ncbi:MAG TPA: acetolactate synthase small subunit [Firmicutes bacterium]|jgi:acetolactate synthase-1/3 small subunit|nr:acetolactate synthase small subunit [Bacillota bacterium]
MGKRVLAILVEDRPGVLTRVSGLFSRRGYNIQNIAVGRTMEPGISRMTVTVDADPLTVEQIVKQLNKQINVLKISDLTDEPSVGRELLLVKVKAEPDKRGDIQQMARTFRARIIDLSPDSMIVEVTGNNEKLEAFLLMMQEFGIKEIASTGKVALFRGNKLIRETRN